MQHRYLLALAPLVVGISLGCGGDDAPAAGSQPTTDLDAGDAGADEAGCSVGSVGCGCYPNATCDDGLICTQGACVDGASETPPPNPKCYTPCKSGGEINGTFVACPADGLMPGCVSGTECVQGSCVALSAQSLGGSASQDACEGSGCVFAGGKPRECTSDVDCPDFQRCIAFGCYSECDQDSECDPGEACYRHVCRARCSTQEASCPASAYCASVDGQNGYCMPQGATESVNTEVIGSFALSRTSAELSNVQTRSSFVITNNAPLALDFTIRKASHTEFTDSGVQIVEDDPLVWLHMGEGSSTSQVNELKVLVEGRAAPRPLRLTTRTTRRCPFGMACWRSPVSDSAPSKSV